MENFGPFQVIAAALAANTLTLVWAYAMWRIGRREAIGRDPTLLQLIIAATPPLLIAYGFWLMK